MSLPSLNKRIERLEVTLGPRKPEASWNGRLTGAEQQFLDGLTQKYGQVSLRIVTDSELDTLEQIALRIEAIATDETLTTLTH
jgi:hypothetical protein